MLNRVGPLFRGGSSRHVGEWIRARLIGMVWRGQGRLRARRCNDKFEWLYAPLDEQPLVAAGKLTPTAAAGSVESV
jgi:hypothetical protein